MDPAKLVEILEYTSDQAKTDQSKKKEKKRRLSEMELVSASWLTDGACLLPVNDFSTNRTGGGFC